MGWLAKLAGAEPPDDENDLGLSVQPYMSREMRQQIGREKARRIARGDVIATEMRVIEHCAYVGQHAVARINRVGELAASVVPEERERVDGLTNTAAVLLGQAMAKLADP